MDTSLFVGYLRLEEWLQAVDRKRPVFALLSRSEEVTSSYVRTVKLLIDVAQPENGQALVHYARLRAGTLRFMADDAVESDHAERIDRAEGLWRIVETWLEDQGLTVMHGLIAAPAGMRFVESWADFIEFDKGTQMFVRKGVDK